MHLIWNSDYATLKAIPNKNPPPKQTLTKTFYTNHLSCVNSWFLGK